eukprot:jgi/Chrzof1/987/Cz01g35250.t1
MQALSAKCLKARPFSGVRSIAPKAANVPKQVALRRAQRSVATAATAPEIADIEATDISTADVPTDVAALPNDKVKLRVRMRGFEVGILADACQQIAAIANITGAKLTGPVFLPTKQKIYCVLRSPHVNKDAREHFEIRTHHRLVDLSNLSAQTVQALMEWVPPSGLEVETSIV